MYHFSQCFSWCLLFSAASHFSNKGVDLRIVIQDCREQNQNIEILILLFGLVYYKLNAK